MSTAKRPLLVVAIVLALTVLIGAAALYCGVFRAAAPVGERVVADREWPAPLVDLLNDAKRHNITLSNVQVYQMPSGEYYWATETSPQLLELMTRSWKLKRVSSDDKAARLAVERLPAALASHGRDKDVDYYDSQEYLPGGEWKGDLYCVMNDKASTMVVVSYYYNF